MRLLRLLLLAPLSVLYGIVTRVRNLLYDKNILSSKEFPVPVICVGNITVGGTGKTPHVEYVAGLLSRYSRVAVLSRGYKRKTRGFRIVSPDDTASMSGDEPLQIASKLRNVMVAVDADRVRGISRLTEINEDNITVVLDDGFQHRSVRAGLNIILTDYSRLMTRDHLLPYGRLRENLKGVSRANTIIVTKSPSDLGEEEMKSITAEISPLAGQNIFFTTFEYGDLLPLFSDRDIHGSGTYGITPGTTIVLVTGIASPAPLINYLSAFSGEIIPLTFPDHHFFSQPDINKITETFYSLKTEEKMIITTEKDAVRLKDFTNIASPLRNKFYYLPVRIKFIRDEEKFIKIITDYAG